MNPALWISKTGLAAQDAKMTAISNNLANVNTTSFKRDRAMFADLFYQNQRTPGGQLDQNNVSRPVFSTVPGSRLSAPRKSSPLAAFRTPGRALTLPFPDRAFSRSRLPTAISPIPAPATCKKRRKAC